MFLCKKKVTINDNFVYFFIDTMKLICYNEEAVFEELQDIIDNAIMEQNYEI